MEYIYFFFIFVLCKLSFINIYDAERVLFADATNMLVT